MFPVFPGDPEQEFEIPHPPGNPEPETQLQAVGPFPGIGLDQPEFRDLVDFPNIGSPGGGQITFVSGTGNRDQLTGTGERRCFPVFSPGKHLHLVRSKNDLFPGPETSAVRIILFIIRRKTGQFIFLRQW